MVLLLLFMPMLGHSTSLGKYFSQRGDKVVVSKRADAFHIYVEINAHPATCTLSEDALEVYDGVLVFKVGACSVKVEEYGPKDLNVVSSGCAQYCESGADLSVSWAARD